jgi:predicted DCC family thiol-disulfide oxidoreductase YuxK
MSLIAIIEGWKKFWFEPKSPTALALFRIFFGLIVLQDVLLMRLPDWRLYYSEKSLVPIADMIVHWWGKDPYFDLMVLLPQGDQWQLAFVIGYAVLALFLTLGLFTRFSAVTVFLFNLSLNNHFQLNQNDGDVFVKLVLLMLAFSNCGDAFSLDNLIRSLRSDWRKEGFAPRVAPQWALRMIQVQMSVVYFHTFLCKLSGDHWVSGVACYYALRYEEMVRFPLPKFFDQLWVCKVLSWGTLVTEFSLFSLIWIKELRYWILLLGLCLHLGIEYSMNLPFFEWLFIVSYIIWIDPKDLTKVWDWVKAQVVKLDGAPYAVAFDGDCIFCVRTAGLLHRLDIFGRFQLVDFRDKAQMSEFPDLNYARAENKLQLKLRDRWVEGFQAFRFMTTRLPWLWFISPFLFIPGVDWVGESIYSSIASRRHLILGGTCHNVCAPATECSVDGDSEEKTETKTEGVAASSTHI